jgi:hypothetical protein
MKTKQLLIIALAIFASLLFSQEAYEGYTLYKTNSSSTIRLLDMDGDTAHSWSGNDGGYCAYLLENGNVIQPARANGTSMNGAAMSGMFEILDWDGNQVWEFEYHGNDYLPHHDIAPMPNGNFLAIAWEIKSGTESYNSGRSSSTTMWPDYLVEIEPTGTTGGNIVWEWHFWDHLIQDIDSSRDNYGVVEDHPELFDINVGSVGGGPGGGADWLHINGVDYNAELDQIVISSHYMDEIYVIDHSTTTAEAAGHTGGNSGMGGDILYRWGNADNYGANDSYQFNVVHCASWIDEDCPGAGNIMAFDNSDDDHQSKVVEIVPPREGTYNYSWTQGQSFAPDQPFWMYSNGNTFYSNHLGGLQRLPNGNTLISESTSGYMFEVTQDGTIVWDKDVTGEVPRCLRYGMDYPGLSALFPNGTVTGTVFNFDTSEPVEDAVITIGSLTANSDSNGLYTISIAEGTYGLTCEHSDYDLYIYTEDVEVEEGETTNIDIYLVPTVNSDNSFIPAVISLNGNHPNPFNPETVISFSISDGSAQTSLKIYNTKGQLVKTLINETLTAGEYNIVWTGTDEKNNRMQSGVYFYNLSSGSFSETQKMVLLK